MSYVVRILYVGGSSAQQSLLQRIQEKAANNFIGYRLYTLLWQGEVDNLDTLVEKLSYRRFSRKVYTKALQHLKERDLIIDDSGKWKLTPAGEQLRQKVEDMTDEYFYAPWESLSVEDMQALETLLRKLTEELGKKRNMRCP